MHEKLSRLAAKLLSRSRYERWFEPAFHELHQDFLKRGGTKIVFALRILAALVSCWLLAAREKTKRGLTVGLGAALARELVASSDPRAVSTTPASRTSTGKSSTTVG